MVKNSWNSLWLQAQAFETNVKEMIKGGDIFPMWWQFLEEINQHYEDWFNDLTNEEEHNIDSMFISNLIVNAYM
jgi:hypothetical protein